MSKQCPFCGESIPGKATRCMFCGEALEEKHETGAVPRPELKQKRCQACGELIDDGCEVCPYCGESTIDEKADGDDMSIVSKVYTKVIAILIVLSILFFILDSIFYII